MGKSLERDLGLYATTTISVGAMIGSGIFVLPGIAFEITGPAVIVAYLLAGVVAMPAVLSKAEMATAMPDAGGTYLYIDRAMGPLLGTVAGVGAWFSLTFKSAFALVGIGAYLVLFSTVPVKLVALAIAGLLLVVNVVGVKQTGWLQSVIVTVVMVVLMLFVADGIINVDSGRYHPFLAGKSGGEPIGILTATGFVFVSYAGVTKIASVAEEVESPGRNIPLAMISSVLVMMLVYVLVVLVLVGVMPADELAGNIRPMADAAGQFLGATGAAVVAVVAVVALTSMANAGILSASRFPYAMSRDALAPPSIEYVHDRYYTPVVALLLTGAILVVLVAFVPVRDLAKLASAFKILVFSLVNVALVAFRESDLESYDPEWVAPGYPWVQLFGIVAGVVLLTRMGLLPLLGAVGILLGGVAWYRIYGRERTAREGAAVDALRRRIGDRAVASTARRVDGDRGGNVLVAVGPDTPSGDEDRLVTLAGHVASHRDGAVHVVRFETVPEQVSLSSAADRETDADRSFEARMETLTAEVAAPVHVDEVVSHDARRAVVNRARAVDATLLLAQATSVRLHEELLGHDVDWFMRHAPCQFAYLAPDGGSPELSEVAVLAQRGPHGPEKVATAGAIAAAAGSTVKLVTVVEADPSEDRRRGVDAFHAELRALCEAPTESVVVESDEMLQGLADATANTDLAVVGRDPHSVVRDVILGDRSAEIAEVLDCPVLFVHSDMSGSTIRRLVKRAVF